ncbi:hypothetical protein [Nocardioides sp. Kera G14]|uniref:hypothetical protein n=1 Tax=Nocardioides sp. Kera G14 TaxID=2884264 RepID=UPI001D0FD221|nr:hypothetical protein [Nocardioides sp. Kera G14]UDY24158.1 hypothetical protein LH076_02350 [Nocardioides sp. Kera G14]
MTQLDDLLQTHLVDDKDIRWDMDEVDGELLGVVVIAHYGLPGRSKPWSPYGLRAYDWCEVERVISMER